VKAWAAACGGRVLLRSPGGAAAFERWRDVAGDEARLRQVPPEEVGLYLEGRLLFDREDAQVEWARIKSRRRAIEKIYRKCDRFGRCSLRTG
jgi:hypothetical protein